MTSGQVALDLAFEQPQESVATTVAATPLVLRGRPRVLRALSEEVAAHEQRLDALDKSAGGVSVWRKLETVEATAEAGSA
jgi:DNA polymerase-3 subunit epsilon